jgi:hypothetical protein
MSKEIELKIKVTVPDEANFIATDRRGERWWYADKPVKGGGLWAIAPEIVASDCGLICDGPNDLDWEDSLIELGEK